MDRVSLCQRVVRSAYSKPRLFLVALHINMREQTRPLILQEKFLHTSTPAFLDPSLITPKQRARM